MRLLAPDMDELSATIKKLSKQGNSAAANIERNKMKQLRRNHGVYPFISLLNIF